MAFLVRAKIVPSRCFKISIILEGIGTSFFLVLGKSLKKLRILLGNLRPNAGAVAGGELLTIYG